MLFIFNVCTYNRGPKNAGRSRPTCGLSVTPAGQLVDAQRSESEAVAFRISYSTECAAVVKTSWYARVWHPPVALPRHWSTRGIPQPWIL